MKNEVTAFGILQALKNLGWFRTTREIAEDANIETTSENLYQIRDELYDFAELGIVEVCYLPTSAQVSFRLLVNQTG